MAKRPTATQRKEVFARARGFCEYCLSPEKFSNSTFEVEHIFPFSKGGETILSNLALSCSSCNKFKSHRTEAFDAKTGKMAPLYNPRRDVWKKHFKWSADYTRIIGLTATGRATIQALKLNRKNLNNLRKLLRLFGEHPPQ
jgi:5-methylcytosine-specific restriction endonuclease McrA